MIKVFVADDEALLRSGLRALLAVEVANAPGSGGTAAAAGAASRGCASGSRSTAAR